MINKNYIKVSVGIIATILLGAIGSGVWEYILKPSLGSLSELILNVATLGIQSFKNDMYLQIAKGFSDQTSIEILNIINSLIIMAAITYILILKDQVFPSEDERLLKDTSNLSLEEKNELIKHYETIVEKTKKKLKKLFFFFSLIIVALIIMQEVTSFKLKYINNAIVYYQQLQTISKPYISDKEFDVISSKFALIKTKQDYILVTNKLEKVLKDNNLEIKKFNVW